MSTLQLPLPLVRQLLVAALVALMLVACKDNGPAPTAAVDKTGGSVNSLVASSNAPATDLIAPTSAAPITPAPEITLSLRGVADDVIEQGEPLRIAVRLQASRDAADTFELAPTSGSWTDAITVEIVPAGGGAAMARAEAVGKPPTPNATLNATRVAGGLWHISAETMQRVTPGDYLVRAHLSIQNGSGWNGEVVSEATPLQVVAVSEDAERVAQRAISHAQDALLDGRVEEAAVSLDAVLQRTPDDGRVLSVRAAVAERAGNPMAAMIYVNRALQARSGTATGQPPIELDELYNRVMAALLAENAERKDPPAWSWPPVLLQPAKEILPEAKTVPALAPTSTPAASGGSALPAAVATPAPAQATAVVPPSPPAAPASSSPAKTGGAGNGTVVPSTQFTDAKVVADTAGQWAVSATAGSQYGKTQYSAAQAVGAPNISVAGNSPDAWCPENKSNGTDSLEVTLAKPVHATEVRVRQNDTAGAIVKVEAIEPDGTTHVWWEGVDPYQAPVVREIAWFGVRVPKTEYLVARIKLTLNLASGPGWKQIDAVQVVGVAQ